MKRIYLLVQTTRDGDELTTMAFASRATAEAKCANLKTAPEGGVSVESVLDVLFFVREMRVVEDEA